MKSGDSKEKSGITSIILLLVIIIVIFLILSYKDKKFDKLKLFHKGQIDHIEMQIDTPDHVEDVHTQLYSDAQVVFNENGLPDLTELLTTDLKSAETTEVEVEDESGEIVKVTVCNNSTGRQPTPINKSLICVNGLELVENVGIFCCDTPDSVEEGHEGLLGRAVITGMKLFNDHPVMGSSAVIFGRRMNGFLRSKVAKLLPKLATSYGKAVANKLCLT